MRDRREQEVKNNGEERGEERGKHIDTRKDKLRMSTHICPYTSMMQNQIEQQQQKGVRCTYDIYMNGAIKAEKKFWSEHI